MSNTAILCIVFLTFVTGFSVGFLTGRMSPKDNLGGHPYDTDIDP